MSQKIDGNLQVPQALRSVTTYKINPDAIASRMLDLDQQLHG